MTPNAQHKRAERERRKAAGYKRVEVWVGPRQQTHLDFLIRKQACDVNEAINRAITDSVFAQD